MSKRTKILWLSANIFGYELLKEALKVKIVDIIAIITLKEETRIKMYDGVDKKKWSEFGIPVYKTENINEEEELLSSLNPDFIIMAGWRQVINKKILNLPKKGFIGFHPTLLPKGRGPAPIINTILAGFEKSGVTMFYINDKVDRGDIIGQAEFKINKNDYALDVYYRAIKKGKALIKKFLALAVQERVLRILQNNKKSSCFPKRTLKDNEIILNKDSPELILKKIKAFSKPYSGAYIKLNDKKLIIWKAELKNEKSS